MQTSRAAPKANRRANADPDERVCWIRELLDEDAYVTLPGRMVLPWRDRVRVLTAHIAAKASVGLLHS